MLALPPRLAVSLSPKCPPTGFFNGTNLGKVYRLDNANSGNPVPVNITGLDFPANSFVSYIDMNPDDADHLMVTFSNYGVKSLFHSSDGGSTWTAVGGNLEENADGSGNGPSVRCTKMLSYQGNKIIFAGTSCGLFSTTKLNGDSTVWVKEGATTIGNVIIDMIDTRQTDGFIAIATHGNGVYSTYFNPFLGLEEHAASPSISVGNIFPNPVKNEAKLEINAENTVNLQITIYTADGKLVKKLTDQTLHPGKQYADLQFGDLKPGEYYLILEAGKKMVVRKFIKIQTY